MAHIDSVIVLKILITKTMEYHIEQFIKVHQFGFLIQIKMKSSVEQATGCLFV